MLMTMKTQVEAMRALSLHTAWCMDLTARHPDAGVRERHQKQVNLLTPIIKGWNGETAQEVTSLNIQIHGGMGFIEETGAAQLYRDARIISIYEGTTGIQANDLLWRKLMADRGTSFELLLGQINETLERAEAVPGEDFESLGSSLRMAVDTLNDSISSLLAAPRENQDQLSAVAVPFLLQTGLTCGAWQMTQAALVARSRIQAGETGKLFWNKIRSARFYGEHILPRALSHHYTVKNGKKSLQPAELF